MVITNETSFTFNFQDCGNGESGAIRPTHKVNVNNDLNLDDCIYNCNGYANRFDEGTCSEH